MSLITTTADRYCKNGYLCINIMCNQHYGFRRGKGTLHLHPETNIKKTEVADILTLFEDFKAYDFMDRNSFGRS